MNIIIGNWKGSLEMVIIIIILLWILIGHLLCSCSKMKGSDYLGAFRDIREGFKGGFKYPHQPASINALPPNPEKWLEPTLLIARDKPLTQATVDILNRKSGKLPLPDSQMDLLYRTEFKPSCCPNTFSTGSGCACMSMKQLKYLNERGGNNKPSKL